MAADSRPNVLLIIADDLRYDAIGPAGAEPVATPNLDRLAESGCAVTEAHNMGSTHGGVCVPARAMLHGGRSLFHRKGAGGITPEHPALPEAFADAGYRTFATGKWHNGREAFNRCFDEGEAIFFGGMTNHWNVPYTARYPIDDYPADRPHRKEPGARGPQPGRATYERYSSGTHATDLFADAMERFLEGHRVDGDGPFFGYLAFTAPHDPRTAPGEYHTLYDPQDIELPASFREAHPFDNGSLHTRDEDLAAHPRDPDVVRRHIADYYAMISHLDARVGDLLDTLERTGQRENTVVVFTADHGLAVGRHGLLGKQNLYDHSVRVPLLLSGPGLPSGETRAATSYHHDLYPTLAELAGLDVPDTVDGRSLWPVLDGDDEDVRDATFTAYSEEQRAIRADGRKLIEYAVDGERHTQLFDLEADPMETENLADDPSMADTVENLRARLAAARQQADDPTLGSGRFTE